MAGNDFTAATRGHQVGAGSVPLIAVRKLACATPVVRNRNAAKKTVPPVIIHTAAQH